VVRASAPLPEPSGMMVCTEPCRMNACRSAWHACGREERLPTISEAEADPPLISHDQRLAFGEIAAAGGEALVASGVRPRVETTSPRFMKALGHRDRLIEQSARIVAEVDDVTRELVLAGFPLKFP